MISDNNFNESSLLYESKFIPNETYDVQWQLYYAKLHTFDQTRKLFSKFSSCLEEN